MPKNILDYLYPEGLQVLDQTLPNFRPTKQRKGKVPLNIVRLAICKKFCDIPNVYSQYFGIILTFKNKWYSFDPEDLHKLVKEKLSKSLVCKKAKYYLFPEFTPQKGHLHYHGVIYDCYDLVNVRFNKWWSRTFGFSKPEKIRVWKNWSQYCYKNISKTGLPVIYKIK